LNAAKSKSETADATEPTSPYGVGGADPLGRTRQSTKGPTHLIKVSVESALSLRLRVDVFGTDYH
jgi:UDP-glucose 4-epimerase